MVDNLLNKDTKETHNERITSKRILRHGSLFSGIGGFDLAAEWMGWENVFHCEINPFGQKVLKHYWPNAIGYTDITKTDFSVHRGGIDILTGGFPCQPFSTAGKRKGTADDRHLWPEMLKAIREIQPRYIVGENVRGITNWNGGMVFDQVQADLEVEGFEVLPFLLPACAVNAPHRRDRIWFVAHANNIRGGKPNESEKQQGRTEAGTAGEEFIYYASDTIGKRFPKRNDKPDREQSQPIVERPNGIRGWQNFPTQPPVCNGDDGLSARLDTITFPKWRKESLTSGGNAVVPILVFELFKAIEATNTEK